MQLLLQVRHKVAEGISRMPRYLCTEMVERKTFQVEAGGRRKTPATCAEVRAADGNAKSKIGLLSADRLRLDVAIIGKNETYSWVGAGQFDDRPLFDRVQHGATGTGSFVSFLQAIFVSDSAVFAYQGESQLNGRRVLNYSFHVPLWRSGWSISNGSVSRITAYRGEFSADADTLDLLQLEIHADGLASDLEMCEVTTSLRYNQVRLNRLDFLLPSEASMQISKPDGRESRNETVFSGCHQFTGESKLTFDEPSTAAPVGQLKANAIELPPDLAVSISLAQTIDPAKAAAGDAIQGRLSKPLHLLSGVTIPKGATINGRICELLVQYGPENAVEFGVSWENLEFGGTTHALQLSLRWAVPGTAKTSNVHARWPEPGAGFTTPEQNSGFFIFSGINKNYRIPAGFTAEWLTLGAAPVAK